MCINVLFYLYFLRICIPNVPNFRSYLWPHSPLYIYPFYFNVRSEILVKYISIQCLGQYFFHLPYFIKPLYLNSRSNPCVNCNKCPELLYLGIYLKLTLILHLNSPQLYLSLFVMILLSFLCKLNFTPNSLYSKLLFNSHYRLYWVSKLLYFLSPLPHLNPKSILKYIFIHLKNRFYSTKFKLSRKTQILYEMFIPYGTILIILMLLGSSYFYFFYKNYNRENP